ncbi:MAG: diguanylate cyclase [Magnetococcales bacterium]|nr:diguanylate cyclase [Magnetococcales bacterium]
MLKYKFLRSTFLLSGMIAILLPFYTIYFAFPVFTDLLTHATERESIRLGRHMARALMENRTGTLEEMTRHPDFKQEADVLLQDFGMSKYRVFDPEGRIVLSSRPEEIGRVNDRPYYFDTVARGQVFTNIVTGPRLTLEGERADSDLVETYIPILRDGLFLGAFEIYFDITVPKTALDRVVQDSSVIMIALGAGFLLLVVVVRKSVVRHVAGVTLAMTRMAQGHLHQRVPESGRDELGHMARIFNRMGEELQRAHAGLADERNKLTTILLSAREGIVVTDAGGRVVLVNPAAQRLLGKDEQRLMDEGFASLIDDPAFVAAFLASSGQDMPDTVVYNHRVLNFFAASIRNGQGEVIGSAALLRDVTQEKQLEVKLRELSYTDGLTDLLNRRRMEEILQEEFLRARRYGAGFGLCMVDVDHFKKFNDQHGHSQGDRVLQAVASAMRDHFRNVDYCCRYGGEEFCVILPYTEVPGTVEAAERFRQKVERMVVDGLKVTVSIGVAEYSQLGKDDGVDRLLYMADAALYEAKGGGRNRVRRFQPGGLEDSVAVAPSLQPAGCHMVGGA